MKQCIFSCLLLILASCMPNGPMKVNNSSTQTKSAPTISQANGYGNWTTLPINQNAGLGPVNMAMSNFYFNGEFQVIANQPSFYDCQTGSYIPIAVDKGDYKNIIKQYADNVEIFGQPVEAVFRGYFLQNTDPSKGNYPHKLVLTYVNSMMRGEKCSNSDILNGVWVSPLPGTEKGKVVLILQSTYTFIVRVLDGEFSNEIKGGWMLTDKNNIYLNFTTINPYIGHIGTINIDSKTIFMTCQKGSLDFRKLY